MRTLLLGTAFTSSWNGFGSGGYIGLIYIAVFSSSLGFLFQAYGQKYIAPTQVALIFSLESVVATIAAALIYQETINAVKSSLNEYDSVRYKDAVNTLIGI